MKKVSGIYKIVNKTDGKYYVGSSNNIPNRWNYHRQDLTRGNHHSPHLQRAWNKYGSHSFDFVIVESDIPNDKLILTEQIYLDKAKKDECYNTSMVAGRIEFTNEIKKKISEKLIGNKNGVGHEVTEEMRMRISQSQTGVKCPQKGNGKKGKSFSEDHKRKLREARKSQVISEETRQKFRNRMIGNTYGKKKPVEVVTLQPVSQYD